MATDGPTKQEIPLSSTMRKLASDLKRRKILWAKYSLPFAVLFFFPVVALAHGVAESDAALIQSVRGISIPTFLYLGAKHMITGYDHLLFLFGVIFFLYRMKDVLTYVSLFTLGHSITLLLGVLAGISADSYIVDAIIGLSVAYKAFDNIGGFRQFFGLQPNTKLAVTIFGLFHGFGLATKLQALSLPPEGLVVNIISFNVGVEIGQALALLLVLLIFLLWRPTPSFSRYAFATNIVVMFGGFLLMGYQIVGYLMA